MLGYLECFEFDMITSPSAIHMNPFALAALDADMSNNFVIRNAVVSIVAPF